MDYRVIRAPLTTPRSKCNDVILPAGCCPAEPGGLQLWPRAIHPQRDHRESGSAHGGVSQRQRPHVVHIQNIQVIGPPKLALIHISRSFTLLSNSTHSYTHTHPCVHMICTHIYICMYIQTPTHTQTHNNNKRFDVLHFNHIHVAAPLCDGGSVVEHLLMV